MIAFNPSRRQVVRGVASAATVLGATSLFAGCAMPPTSEHAAVADEIRILGADGYGSDGVLAAFSGANGVTVTAEPATSDADTVKRLQGGEAERWDLVSVGHVSARHALHAQGLIRQLDRDRFGPAFDGMLPAFHRPFEWAMGVDGGALIGIPQRFDVRSLVVNTDKVSLQTAEELGFALFNDEANQGRFGILTDDTWNIAHMCVGAGVDPFKPHSHDDIVAFEKCARKWFKHARLLSYDPAPLNHALVAGDIDFYCSGGIAAAAPARLEGHANVRAVTPARGTIDGSAGIVRVELLCVVDNSRTGELAEAFIEHVQRPEVIHAVASANGAPHPVAQLGREDVRARFSAAELQALQWDTLEQDMARVAFEEPNPDFDQMVAAYSSAPLGLWTPRLRCPLTFHM